MSNVSVGSQLGPYELLNLLGRGGMGEVYRAHDSRLDRPVALKLLPPEFSSDSKRLARFLQEARVTARLNHPNILAVYDVGSYLGIPFVVSELLDGRTLRGHLKERKLPVATAIRYGRDLARGLIAAHRLGIVHRDLKPENIFITRDDRLKILDFGVAKCRDAAVARPPSASDAGTPVSTESGMLIGTVGYVSPEQARGECVDSRSDIFSVGIVLYEMIAGVPPFQGDSSVETLHAILKEQPIALQERDGRVPPHVEEVVHHCLEKDPESRFQSAQDLAFTLDLILGLFKRDQRSGKYEPADPRASRQSRHQSSGVPGLTPKLTGLALSLRGVAANCLMALFRVLDPTS